MLNHVSSEQLEVMVERGRIAPIVDVALSARYDAETREHAVWALVDFVDHPELSVQIRDAFEALEAERSARAAHSDFSLSILDEAVVHAKRSADFLRGHTGDVEFLLNAMGSDAVAPQTRGAAAGLLEHLSDPPPGVTEALEKYWAEVRVAAFDRAASFPERPENN